MTYCVAFRLEEGLVLLSDTRTNAGVDNVSRFRKTHVWERPGDRVIALLTAGNLGVTQGVISLLEENIHYDKSEAGASIMTAPSMYRVAELVGAAMRCVQDRDRPGLLAMNESSGASVLVCGQRKGGQLRLFQIYSAGNFIEATDDTPYFQIGEHKYGKPIIDRVVTPTTPLADAVTVALLSMDSTLRSNLSVGMPLDLTILRRDALEVSLSRRIEAEDPDFRALSHAWSDALREAYQKMSVMPFAAHLSRL